MAGGGPWLPPHVREEAWVLAGLALPVIITNALLMLLQIEDQVFLGHLGTDELAAAALGNTYYNICWFFIAGATTACDTLCAQAWGAKDYEATDFWTRMGFLVMTLMCIPAALLFQFSEQVIQHVFMQPEHLAKMGGRYTQLLLPGLWFVTMFSVMQKSLQARGILMPSVWIMLLSNVLNIGGNVLFVHTLGLGFEGSPIATSTSRVITCLMMAAYYFSLPKVGETARRWPCWGRKARAGAVEKGHAYGAYEALQTSDADAPTERPGGEKVPFWQAFRRFLALAIPGGFMVGLEAWSFDLTVIFAAHFGTEAVDAHQSMMSISAFTFLSIPLAIAIAATIRVGNLLGAQKPRQAQLSARICIWVGTSIMAVLAVLVISLRGELGKVFSPDPRVVEIVRNLAPIMALYQVMDGFQGVSAGVLRGMGSQKKIAALNLCGFWVLGLPGGALLAFKLGFRVYGIWWGFVIGLTLVSLMYMGVLARVDYYAEAKKALQAVTDVKLEHDWEEVIDHRPLLMQSSERTQAEV